MVAVLERAALYFCDCQGWAEVMVIAFVVLCIAQVVQAMNRGFNLTLVSDEVQSPVCPFASQMRAEMGTIELADC